MPRQFTKKQKELTKTWDSKSKFPFGKEIAEYQFNSQKYYHESPQGAPGIEIISQPSENVQALSDESALRYALTKYVICGYFSEKDDLSPTVREQYDSLVSELENISRQDDVEVVGQKIGKELSKL